MIDIYIKTCFPFKLDYILSFYDNKLNFVINDTKKMLIKLLF